MLAATLICSAQDNMRGADTLTIPHPLPIADSLAVHLPSDTLTKADSAATADTLKPRVRKSNSELKDKVEYNANDSMRISVDGRMLYLYNNAVVKYQDIVLKANYIALNFGKNEVFARGTYDTLGKVTGAPNFTKGNETFDCDSLKYNFKTEKGIIYNIVSKQGEGYFHSEKTKREANGIINAEGNKYTTCDLKHPHFYLALNKAIVIPNDKIITGYAYLVVADVPIKIPAIPFGFFPNSTTRSSGVIIPTYGEEQTRGFYLARGGWYQVLGDYADLEILGDKYSKGSWAVHNSLGYNWRYHFSGRFTFDYSVNKDNEDISFPTQKDYRISWSHRQDSKANPTRNFSASVNFSSREYSERNSRNYNARVNTNKNSSINFSKNWPGTPFSFNASAQASQNTISKQTDLRLPSATFRMTSIYPFRSKTGSGQYKWYENINLGYSAEMLNEVSEYDSLLLSHQTLKDLNTDLKQSVPFGVNFKVGKLITITPSLTYTGILHTKYAHHKVLWDPKINNFKDTVDYMVHQINYLQAINPNLSVSLSPKIYGMFVSKKTDGYFVAMRHVMSPVIGFSYTPYMGKINPDYYDTLVSRRAYPFGSQPGSLNKTQNIWPLGSQSNSVFKEVYSPWENQQYGVPSSSRRQGNINFALNNNLEMKVMPKNDTTGKPKKVSILQNLNFSTSYNLFADSLNWSDINFTGGTSLFNNGLDIRFGGLFSPYALDDKGQRINKFYYNKTGKILRFSSVNFSANFSLKSKSKKKDDNTTEDQNQDNSQDNADMNEDIEFGPRGSVGSYVDFNIPWSFNFQFNTSYSKGPRENLSATININGDFSLTPKWKIGMNSGYDLIRKSIVSTNIRIHRDLHCWTMDFSVVPIGKYKSYSFTIRAKASILHDLKYEKRPNWYDNF